MTAEDCPHCGADVPSGARACPECGSDESTGWSQTAHCDNLGIPDPDEEFDYDAFVENEFGRANKRSARPSMIWALWTLISIVVIAVILGLIR